MSSPRRATRNGTNGKHAKGNGKPPVTEQRYAPQPRQGGARLPLGAHPGNTGGKKGRSGRKPDWYRDWCEELLAHPKSKAAVRAVMFNKDHPAFATMHRMISERRYGKPSQIVGVAGDGATLEDLLARTWVRDGDEHTEDEYEESAR